MGVLGLMLGLALSSLASPLTAPYGKPATDDARTLFAKKNAKDRETENGGSDRVLETSRAHKSTEFEFPESRKQNHLRIERGADSELNRLRSLRGPNEGGGGHPFETAFKNAVLRLLQQIRDEYKTMTAEQKAALLFDPFAMYIKLNQPKAFYVLCASNVITQKMQFEGKMARVYPQLLDTIFLDCSKESLIELNKIVARQTPEVADTFLLHEAIRVYKENSSSDHDYSESMSYSKALALDPQFEGKKRAEALYRLLFTPAESSKCYMKIQETSGNPNLSDWQFRISLWVPSLTNEAREQDFYTFWAHKTGEYSQLEPAKRSLQRLLILINNKNENYIKETDVEAFGKKELNTLFEKAEIFYVQALQNKCFEQIGELTN